MSFIINEKNPCRCGYVGGTVHLCHRCGKAEGTMRFYANVSVVNGVAAPVDSLAGAQLKTGATQTFGCDRCWEEYTRQVSALLGAR